MGELQDVVGDADDAPFGGDLLDPAQRELAKAARLLDLSEHRLGQLLAQGIGAVVAAGLDLFAHRGDARAAAFSRAGVFGPPGRDIGVDPAFLQRREVGVGAVAGVGRKLRRSAAQIGFDRVGDRRQVMLIALPGVEAMGDDQLRRRIDRRLRVVALTEPVLDFMKRLSGSVKFFCALGSGSSEGGAAGFPGFLRPSAFCSSSASACALALAAAASLASASNSACAALIFSARFFLSATQSGISSPLLSRPNALSSPASIASAALIHRATSASSSAARFAMRS